MEPSTDRPGTDYYRADVIDLNVGEAATRALDPLDDKEYTYATTQFEAARAIAAGTVNFACIASSSPSPSTLPRTTLVISSSGLHGALSSL
jgi:hypothetical protein